MSPTVMRAKLHGVAVVPRAITATLRVVSLGTADSRAGHAQRLRGGSTRLFCAGDVGELGIRSGTPPFGEKGGTGRRRRWLFTKGCRATTRAWRHPLARPWSMRHRRGWRSPRSPPPPRQRRPAVAADDRTTSTQHDWRRVFNLSVTNTTACSAATYGRRV